MQSAGGQHTKRRCARQMAKGLKGNATASFRHFRSQQHAAPVGLCSQHPNCSALKV